MLQGEKVYYVQTDPLSNYQTFIKTNRYTLQKYGKLINYINFLGQ